LVGIDIHEAAVWYASRKGVGFVAQASAHRLPFRDDFFDAVTLIDVLVVEGLEDGVAIREAQRVLRESGLLVVNVAAFEWLRGEHDVATRTRHRYRKEEIRALLSENGFELKHVFYWNSLLLPLVVLMRKILRPARIQGTPRSDLSSVPKWLSSLLAGLLAIDVALARTVGFPLGTSIYCMAYKKQGSLVDPTAQKAFLSGMAACHDVPRSAAISVGTCVSKTFPTVKGSPDAVLS
jgi:SAM-dependent methyltransferase